MTAVLKINPQEKEKFKHVLNIYNDLKKSNTPIRIISEGDDYFEIEYEKEQQLFNFGRAFEPYKMPTKMGTSFEINFDNSYINKI